MADNLPVASNTTKGDMILPSSYDASKGTYTTPYSILPFCAFVSIKIGEYDVVNSAVYNRPQYLQSFSFTRNTVGHSKEQAGVNNFTFTVFDETMLELDAILSLNYMEANKVQIQYGYVNGTKSPIYQGTIMNVKRNFRSGGAVFTVTGTTSSYAAARFIQRTKVYKNMLISDIVKEIAKIEGWEVGEIEETYPIYIYEDNLEKKVLKSYTQDNIDSITFIRERLIPEATTAKSKGKVSNYNLYFKDFVSSNRNSSKNTISVNFKPADFSKKPVRIYDYYYRRKSLEILDFSAEINMQIYKGTNLGTYTVNFKEGDLFKDKVSEKDANKEVLSDKKTVAPVDVGRGGSFSQTVIPFGPEQAEEINAQLKRMYAYGMSSVYRASLTVMGDPLLERFQIIEVDVFNKYGVKDHSSGIYCINQITDTISGGSFVTRLELIKNSGDIGKYERTGISQQNTANKASTDAAKQPDIKENQPIALQGNETPTTGQISSDIVNKVWTGTPNQKLSMHSLSETFKGRTVYKSFNDALGKWEKFIFNKDGTRTKISK